MIPEDFLEEEETHRQPAWYLLTGLILGLGLGLLISLVISPTHYRDTSPAFLNTQDKNAYRMLIARSYMAGGDLPRARKRLALLSDSNTLDSLTAQAQELVSNPQGEEDARALAALAVALRAPVVTLSPTTDALAIGTPAADQTTTPQKTETVTSTPQASLTPRSSPTVQTTLEAPFSLVSHEALCDPSLPPGQMQIEVNDADGKPLSGVQINVAWDGGLDSFYTGLKPEVDRGYADFTMSADVIYSLRVSDMSQTMNGLSAPACPTDGEPYLGGLRLIFKQIK